MRAPPESFRPTTGAPSFIARSMILTIFAAFVSDSDPPTTVKSCANANTWRPSTRPWPATTPSPGTSCSSMPKSRQRCVTSLSTSSNVPGSKRSSIRSRAVSLPASCWRFCRSAPPPSSARRSRSASTSFGFTLRFHRLRLLPVFEELLEADVRERMVEQLIDDGRRARRDVGAEACRLDDVDRMTAARDEDLGREVVVRVDLDDVANQLHAVGRDVVEPSDERADVAGADLRGEQRLRRREAERHIDADAFARERLARADAVARQRHLHHHVLIDLRDVAPLAQHAGVVGRRHLAADGTFHDVANPLQVLAEIARLLREERRIRRDAVEDAERGDRFDVLDAAGVDEDFHGVPFLTFSPLILNHYRATSSTRSDHALELPALSTALIAYT